MENMHMYINRNKQGCGNPTGQAARRTKFRTVAPNICVSSAWNSLRIIFLASIILRRSLCFFLNLCTCRIKLTSCDVTFRSQSSLLLEKLKRVAHIIRNFFESCGSESALPFPQQLAIVPFRSHPAISYLRKINFKITLPPKLRSPEYSYNTFVFASPEFVETWNISMDWETE